MSILSNTERRKIMTKKPLFIAISIIFVLFSIPASAARVTLIHGLPALPGAVPSFNPVDIAIDGVCEGIYRLYGAKLGPIEFDPGVHSFTFYDAAPGQPCSGNQLAATQINVTATTQIDVALGLNAEDEVAISIWDNAPSLFAVEGTTNAAVEVRHAAAGPILGAILTREGILVETGGLPAGLILGPIVTTPGIHTLQILKGVELLGETIGDLLPERVYWVYVTGSVFKGTVNILAIESIPGAPTAGNPPGPPKFTTCCFFGTPTQLSQNQCQATGGIFIGDVDPAKAVCP
jgi:hypothetical protein